MYPHRIRLREPWESEPLDSGQTRYRRRFGCPTNLDEYERVWLTFAGTEEPFTATLNGHRLDAKTEVEATSLLQLRNELVIETSGQRGEIAMEIRRTAFLRNVRFLFNDSRLQIEGDIAGSSERSLEVYVVLDRSSVAYGMFPAGTAFHLTSDPVGLTEKPVVRVDLVDGATVWYRLETTLPLP